MDKKSIIFVVALSASLFLINQWFGTKSAERKNEKPLVQQAAPVSASTESVSGSASGRLYVLQNSSQQLVFSSVGGAITEINLPFSNKGVRPINIDTTLQQDYPANALFPSGPFSVVSEGKIMEKSTGQLSGFYPLLRRNIYNDKAIATFKVPANHYAFNILSNDPKTATIEYRLTRFDGKSIQFEGSDGARKITKTFTISQDTNKSPYCFDLEIVVDGDASNLWLTTGLPEVELISGSFSPTLKTLEVRNQKNVVSQLSLPKQSLVQEAASPKWICNSNGFLGLIVSPLNAVGQGYAMGKIPGELAPSRLSVIDAQHQLYPADKYPAYQMQLPLNPAAAKNVFRIYAGPFESDVLKLVDTTFSDAETGKTPRYIMAMSFHGWFTFISEPFAKFLFILMKIFYKVTRSWGLSIILLTAALRLMLYPLNSWSMKSTLKMQQIAPQIQAIQEKYKKEPKKAQLEVVALYKEKGVNPLSGCFPILIQLPFLIGMFDLLKSTFELRGASFIPGWINNLTAPDVLFSWDKPLFFFGNSFHLLPFLLGGIMYLQQKLSSNLPKDTKLLSEQQKQQKLMGNIMVVVFTVMFYNFPSGLNIYWLSSMGLGILQQWMTNKKMSPPKNTLKRVK